MRVRVCTCRYLILRSKRMNDSVRRSAMRVTHYDTHSKWMKETIRYSEIENYEREWKFEK